MCDEMAAVGYAAWICHLFHLWRRRDVGPAVPRYQRILCGNQRACDGQRYRGHDDQRVFETFKLCREYKIGDRQREQECQVTVAS